MLVHDGKLFKDAELVALLREGRVELPVERALLERVLGGVRDQSSHSDREVALFPSDENDDVESDVATAAKTVTASSIVSLRSENSVPALGTLSSMEQDESTLTGAITVREFVGFYGQYLVRVPVAVAFVALSIVDATLPWIVPLYLALLTSGSWTPPLHVWLLGYAGLVIGRSAASAVRNLFWAYRASTYADTRTVCL